MSVEGGIRRWCLPIRGTVNIWLATLANATGGMVSIMIDGKQFVWTFATPRRVSGPGKESSRTYYLLVHNLASYSNVP